jgi:hypothetical protein
MNTWIMHWLDRWGVFDGHAQMIKHKNGTISALESVIRAQERVIENLQGTADARERMIQELTILMQDQDASYGDLRKELGGIQELLAGERIVLTPSGETSIPREDIQRAVHQVLENKIGAVHVPN